jgi:2-polyprenyl-3-methyl-5-hydroxy-6-metoxy-1,4-benzoquinol methylase
MPNVVDERGYNQIFRAQPAQRVRLKRRAEAIAAEIKGLPAQKPTKVLELGCGTGELAYELALLTGAEITGVDLSQRFIDQARSTYQHENLAFSVADLSKSKPGSESEKYHFIVGNGILHHLYRDLGSFLPALSGWLLPRGRIIFWEPNLVNPYVYLIFSIRTLRHLAKLEPGEMAFTTSFIREKLERAGFDHIRIAVRDFLLPNIPTSLIGPSISVGRVLEKLPFVKNVAQSIFLVAQARGH